MGEANESERCKMENLSIQTNRYPRDLLQRFVKSGNREVSMFESAVEDSEEIELNLGLSLGGKFGVDKNKSQLMRSSSLAGSMAVVGDDVFSAPVPVSYAALIRTSSLPTETEDEWRKRKELQSLRRMEAKRRRSEKQKNTKSDRDSGGSGGGGGVGGVERSFEDERREIEGNSPPLKLYGGLNSFGSAAPPPIGVSAWAATARKAVVCGGGIDVIAKGKGGFVGGGSGSWQGFVQPSSQGSAESQGGSSSGMSDLESKPLQVSSNCEDKSPSSIHSLQERSTPEAVVSFGTKTNEVVSKIPVGMDSDSPSKKPEAAEKKGKEMGTTSGENMPCVFTIGDGPNGRRIDGILYKYGKGEEVRIMCVCHGSFLSPTEFVKHAGGGDVAHPLRHIVVNTSSNASSL